MAAISFFIIDKLTTTGGWHTTAEGILLAVLLCYIERMSGCFYRDGLRFECQRCLYCCSSEPGYVYLTKEDIISASAEVGLSPRAFIGIYCRIIDFGTFSMVSLREKSNYDCIFLTGSGCSIYRARPEQCRSYPFWPSVLRSRESWNEEGRSCPGIGKGALVSRREIEERMKTHESYIIMKGNEVWEE